MNKKERLIIKLAEKIYLTYLDHYLQRTFGETWDPEKRREECFRRARDFYKNIDVD